MFSEGKYLKVKSLLFSIVFLFFAAQATIQLVLKRYAYNTYYKVCYHMLWNYIGITTIVSPGLIMSRW